MILKAVSIKIRSFYYYCSQIGLWGLINLKAKLALCLILSKFKTTQHCNKVRFFLKGYRYPIIIRHGTSDHSVFKQIFIEKELDTVKDDNFKFIIDCGANVGYSTLYFLRKYPAAHIITIEPEASNYDICALNLLPYKDRVTLINSAVFPVQTGLVICRGQYKDGREWATQVRPCKEGEKPDITSVDLASIIDEFGCGCVDLLKIDIERGEAILFSEPVERWLPKVKNIMIELHDNECNDIFFKTLLHYDYETFKYGDLTICKNIRPKKKG